jgi:anti-anti-sigma factor
MSHGHFVLDRAGDASVVRVIGDVDFANRTEFEGVLLQTDASAPLSISFLDCTFCDSSIIGALMKLRTARPESAIRLLVAPKTAVARVFELVGIDRVFPISPSEESIPAA